MPVVLMPGEDAGGDRLPPHSVAAEAALLGAVLRDNRAADDLPTVRAECFYLDAHQKLWRAAADLLAARRPADPVTLHEVLKARGQLEDAGGAKYLAELWEAAPVAANAGHYARIVLDHALRRSLIRAATEAVRDAYDQVGPAADALAALEARLGDLGADPVAGEPVSLAEAVAEGLAEARHRADPTRPRLRTGFADLDAIVPSLEPGSLIVLGARPSVGKSALGLAFALNLTLGQGHTTLVHSLEMRRAELGMRAAAMLGRVSAKRLRDGTTPPDDLDRLERATADLAGQKLFIDDSPGRSVGQIAAAARRVKRRHGLGAVVVDYLQLLTPLDRKARRQEQVGQISRSLKLMARELRCPVVALAQLNRECEARADGEPLMSDLREAGDLEQDADDVYLMWRPKGQPDDAPVWRINLKVDKQRNGPTGLLTLAYRRAYMLFEDAARDW